MKKFYVYVHTCPNGKRYVGCTTQTKPEYRWQEGRGYWYNKHFYSAILKYGWDNFEHEVFEVESEEEMYRKEIELISFYHSNDPEYGYNNSTGGEHSSLGCIRSEEARKHCAEAQRKKWTDPEYRKKQSEAVKKSLSDPEVRRKMSEVQKKVHSDLGYRKKQSEAAKGKPHSEEHKRHIAEAMKGKLRSEETKRKISETINKRNSDPEFRKKLSESKKGKPHKPFSEEARKHISESLKGKPKPKVKIKLPDGTIIEMTKNNITQHYVNKGKEFEYVS